MMNAEKQVKQWGQVVAKAWQNDQFKKRLMAEPATVLKENGVDVPAGVQLRVVENTDQVVHVTLPAKPREGELSDAELAGVAGGESVRAAVVRGLAAAFGWTSEQTAKGVNDEALSPQQRASDGPA
jgi:hypothetical protein